jgi:hypothetical protein
MTVFRIFASFSIVVVAYAAYLRRLLDTLDWRIATDRWRAGGQRGPMPELRISWPEFLITFGLVVFWAYWSVWVL